MAYPTRSAAIPYAFENVRNTNRRSRVARSAKPDT